MQSTSIKNNYLSTIKAGYLGFLIATFFLFIQPESIYAQTEEYKEAFSAYQVQDFDKAEAIWRKLAEQSDINALYALGVMELRGESDNANQEQAFRWFQQAASQGHVTAMFNVGVAFWGGSGTEQNREKALRWWQESANAGDSGAQFNLGLAYYIGEERPADLNLAAKWIGKAASQKHPEAKRIYKILSDENPDIVLAAAEELATENPPTSVQTEDPKEVLDTEVIPTPTTTSDDVMIEEQSAEISNLSRVVAEDDTPSGNQYWRTVTNSPLQVLPEESAFAFDSLPPSTPVDNITNRGDWTLVTLPAGLKMWVFENFLSVNGEKGTIKGTGVRVRPKPSTDNSVSPPVGAYHNGDRVTILEKSDRWYKIRAPKHIGGWVRTSNLESYVDTKENREELWKLMVAKGL